MVPIGPGTNTYWVSGITYYLSIPLVFLFPVNVFSFHFSVTNIALFCVNRRNRIINKSKEEKHGR